jgi:hypothetical protein
MLTWSQGWVDLSHSGATRTMRQLCVEDDARATRHEQYPDHAPIGDSAVNNIIYIVGVVVIVLFILGFLGFR